MKTPALLRGFCLLYLLLLTNLAAAQQLVTAGTGLRGQYYAGKNFEKLVLTRLDKTIDFTWTIGLNGNRFVSPGPGVPAEWFSVRWTGHVYAPVTGVYTFQMTTDDGMRVWIGGHKVLDSWLDQRVAQYTTHVVLAAGRYYSLRVEYYQVRWATRALLAWQLPNSFDDLSPIPRAYLYPNLPATAKPLFATPPLKLKAPAAAAAALKAAVPPAPSKLETKLAAKRAASTATRRAPLTRSILPGQPRPVLPRAVDTLVTTLPALSATNKGAAVTLPNLYFTQSSTNLLPTSRPTLNSLAQILRQQPALRLEIAGHTDNVGEPTLNLRLSEQRAQVVRKYLVQQGIDSARLVARGYGGTRPMANNGDPQQRARNRRVEVVVQ